MTGEILRAGSVPVFELRASMIVGHGSTSWKIVCDLAFASDGGMFVLATSHRDV